MRTIIISLSLFFFSFTGFARQSIAQNAQKSITNESIFHKADRSSAAKRISSALKPLWPTTKPLAFCQALDATGAGFSFMFEGATVGPGIGNPWQVSGEKSGNIQITTFRHPSGLVVVREATAFHDFDAVEYTVRFKNESSRTLGLLGPIQALDLAFGPEVVAGVSMVSSGGGGSQRSYPPADFAIQRRDLLSPVTLTTSGGRSSNKDLPFFFIDNEALGQGFYVAVGWSGQWSAETKIADGRLHLLAGIPGIQIRLQPGEEIPGPRILLGGYRGSVAEGSNRLRRLIRSHYTPSLDAKPFTPIATYDHWWNIGTEFDEPLLRKLADAAGELGQEYFLLDAGWYGGLTSTDFGSGLGNWEEIDNVKFPLGLRPFSDYLAAKGLHFGLWFEPERVAGGSQLARQHPDWIIWLPSEKGKDPSAHSGNYGLLDYGRPDVQEWVKTLLSRYISDFDIRYIRYDFNMNPLAYWDGADTEGRRGISQIRHIDGFYKVIDWVREHHPKTVLEGCASGGRRIDLETAKRFHTFWISDETSNPDIVRWHLHGLNYFLPGNYLYVCYTKPKPETEPESGFQSFLGGAFGTGGRIDQWTPEVKMQAAKHIAVFKKIRRFLLEDYYPLTLQSKDQKSWEAWQFHDPLTQEGFVQAFRLKSDEPSVHICLRGLQPGLRYRFTDSYSGESQEISGSVAMERGIEFRLTSDASQVLEYRKVE